MKVEDYNYIESGSEENLQEAVATIGPISVDIDASPRAFKHYTGGIVLPCSLVINNTRTPQILGHRIGNCEAAKFG